MTPRGLYKRFLSSLTSLERPGAYKFSHIFQGPGGEGKGCVGTGNRVVAWGMSSFWGGEQRHGVNRQGPQGLCKGALRTACRVVAWYSVVCDGLHASELCSAPDLPPILAKMSAHICKNVCPYVADC